MPDDKNQLAETDVSAPSESANPLVRLIEITADEADMRLDRWFRRRFPDLTHGHLQKLLRSGQVRLDGRRVEANTRLEPGQKMRLPPRLGETPAGAGRGKGALDDRRVARLKAMVLYQDDDVVVLNKPPGLAVQGGTGLRENLDDMLMAFSVDGTHKPKLVHRLDRETSGVLLIARTDFAATRLAAAFRHRDTKKIYWAVTRGLPRPDAGRIDAPLVRRGQTMAVAERGDDDWDEAKSAATLYEVVEHAHKKASFVVLSPLTGRTHQLRAHMACLGTPILGDDLYGGGVREDETLPLEELGKGLHLHARRLVVPHPRRGVIDVTAPLSDAMRRTWEWFGFNAKAEVDFSDR